MSTLSLTLQKMKESKLIVFLFNLFFLLKLIFNKKEDKFISFNQAIEKLMELLNIHGSIKIQDKYTRDGFFDSHRDIYDSSEYWYENIYVNKKNWFIYKYGIEPPGHQKLYILTEWWEDEVKDIVENYFVHNEDDWYFVTDANGNEFELYQMTFDEIETKYPDLYQDILELIEDQIDLLTFWDLENEGILSELYEIQYPEEEFDEIEMLAYWTVYFEPRIFDEKIAWKVGLYPFEYNELQLLALGGCGMDLSPLLDAYQALVADSVRSSSKFLDNINHDYAKYVVGEDIFDEVMQRIQRDTPIFHIHTW